MSVVTVDLALWAAGVGVVSAVLGAVGAGVGVYVSMRMEIVTVKAELHAFRQIVQARIDDLTADLKMISEFARQHTKPGRLS
jgi:hypothetical protein